LPGCAPFVSQFVTVALHHDRLPVFPRHVYMERIPDYGSRDWKEFQARAKVGGFMVAGRPL